MSPQAPYEVVQGFLKPNSVSSIHDFGPDNLHVAALDQRLSASRLLKLPAPSDAAIPNRFG